MNNFGIAPGVHPTKEVEEFAVQAENPKIHQRNWGLTARVDPTVTWEEYQYWAKVERAEEAETNRLYQERQGPKTVTSAIKGRFAKGTSNNEFKVAEQQARKHSIQIIEGGDPIPAGEMVDYGDEKKGALPDENREVSPDAPMRVSEEEWRTAARALRTAGWGSIFFLITTDILGWSSCPFVFASVGYGPGVALYVIFGLFAAFSGWILWKVFLGLDSTRFPMLSYGDTFFRVYGSKSRHFINVTQSLQQFFTVCVLILANGLSLDQIAQSKICFIVSMLIMMILGMISGSIRTLQRLGWLCNLSVWFNVISFIIIMIAASHFPIDYAVITQSTLIKTIGPVHTFPGPPPAAFQQQAVGFASQFNAVNSMVYAYSGALLFIAFLGEMRHPMDFWKGLFLAQTFIAVIYLFFGIFVYSFYGQYSASNIGQVIQPYALQTVGNVLGLLTGLIACFLYFNIGMKTVYIEVFQEVFHFPSIATKRGKMAWYILGPMYWIIAFIVAAAVPNLNGIVSFVGGLFSINFTYSFPAILYVGYLVQQGAELPGEGFDPHTGVTTRHDSGVKRWMRGYRKNLLINLFTTAYAICGLACSGMGTWAAVEGLIQVFGPDGTVATSFGCDVPL